MMEPRTSAPRRDHSGSHPKLTKLFPKDIHRWVLDRIAKVAEQVCVRQFPGFRSIILTGSLARSEATILVSKTRWKIAGDAEFLLILAGGHHLPNDAQLKTACSAIEAELSRLGVQCSISLSAAMANYLRRLKPHIFAFELSRHGRVISGDLSVLDLIPKFGARDIPLEDAWRLLSNRMCEHVEIAGKIADFTSRLAPQLEYHTVKVCLDTVTSLTLFAGNYSPSYRARQQALECCPSRIFEKLELPVAWNEFLDVSAACSRWKLDPQLQGLSLDWDRWRKINRCAAAVWRWELQQLAGLRHGSDAGQLLLAWNRSQPISKRFKAWANLIRLRGLDEARRNWRRWLTMRHGATPRDWTYRVAFELFSALPILFGLEPMAVAAEPDWSELNRSLPLRGAHSSESPRNWRRLAEDVALNYRLIAERTTT